MTADILALWLRTSPAEQVQAMTDLVMSSDMRIVSQVDIFTVERAHADPVTHYETGTAFPPLPSAVG